MDLCLHMLGWRRKSSARSGQRVSDSGLDCAHSAEDRWPGQQLTEPGPPEHRIPDFVPGQACVQSCGHGEVLCTPPCWAECLQFLRFSGTNPPAPPNSRDCHPMGRTKKGGVPMTPPLTRPYDPSFPQRTPVAPARVSDCPKSSSCSEMQTQRIKLDPKLLPGFGQKERNRASHEEKTAMWSLGAPHGDHGLLQSDYRGPACDRRS